MCYCYWGFIVSRSSQLADKERESACFCVWSVCGVNTHTHFQLSTERLRAMMPQDTHTSPPYLYITALSLSKYIYLYVFIYNVNIYTYIFTHMYIYIYTHTYIHIYIQKHTLYYKHTIYTHMGSHTYI